MHTEIILLRGVENIIVEINSLNIEDRIVDYSVYNLPICEYDQHSRARVGVKFSEYKVSNDPVYILYTSIYDKISNDDQLRASVIDTLEKLEVVREKSIYKHQYNLMSRSCSYRVNQTFDSLRGQMGRRLKFCEEEFICSLHFLLRDILIKDGVEEAVSWLPDCDKAQVCNYSDSDYLSNLFGCLFASCGRWPSGTDYATFNQSCSDKSEIEKQLNIIIP